MPKKPHPPQVSKQRFKGGKYLLDQAWVNHHVLLSGPRKEDLIAVKVQVLEPPTSCICTYSYCSICIYSTCTRLILQLIIKSIEIIESSSSSIAKDLHIGSISITRGHVNSAIDRTAVYLIEQITDVPASFHRF